MAERAELEGLPGVFALGWLMLMKPVTLYHRLKALGIDQDALPQAIWRSGDLGRSYIMRVAILILVGTVLLTVGVSLAIGISDLGVYFNPYALIVAVVAGIAAGIVIRMVPIGRLGFAADAAPGVVALCSAIMTSGILDNYRSSIIVGDRIPINRNEFLVSGVTAFAAMCVVITVAGVTLRRNARLYSSDLPPLGEVNFLPPVAYFIIPVIWSFTGGQDLWLDMGNLGLSLAFFLSIVLGVGFAIYANEFQRPVDRTFHILAFFALAWVLILLWIGESSAEFRGVSLGASKDERGYVFSFWFVGLTFFGGLIASTFFLYLRLPLYVAELPWQIVAFIVQRRSRHVTLSWSPVLLHERSHLPLPTLAAHIVDTARRDPALALRALHACNIAPGQRWVAERARPRVIALLRARELINLAAYPRPNFQALSDLRGQWLPDPATADGIFPGLQEVGRYLRSAELTLLPNQRREQIQAASDRLRQIENSLRGRRDFESRTYRPAIAAWRTLIDNWLAETEHAAAAVLPNPFRAGDPLDPEFGLPVFRGREPLIAELESILGDPSRGGSLALIGPRRCGKTSLLKMLPLKLPDSQTVFFDVLDHPIDSPAALAAALVRSTREQARRDRQLALPDLPSGPPMEALSEWLQRLEAFTGIGRILICIDEYERWADLFPGDRRALLQFLGLIRATIQHRRRVRFLISGATWLDELEPVWADHFVNLRQLAIGHLTQPVVTDLLTRPTTAFPPDAIPTELAQAIWGRTRGQPYLTQLYGQLVVERLNRDGEGRRQAVPTDCAAVEPKLLDQAGAFFGDLVRRAPEPAQEALKSLARGERLALDTLDPASRRYLLRRSLIDESGGLGIPVLDAYFRREEAR